MTEPYAVPVPRGYRVGVWEVREPIATGAFGSVYEARRTGGDDGTKASPTRPGGDGTGHRPSRPGTTGTTGTTDTADTTDTEDTDGTGRSQGTGTGTPSRAHTDTVHPAEDGTDDPGDTGGDGMLRRPGRPSGADGSGGAGGEAPDTVALKFLPTGTGTPRQLSHLRDLVEREVELLRRLRRPRLIRMYETLTVDDPGRPRLDGATVLVLERAEGSLSALLSATPRPPAGPALLAQVCEGLHQLHRAGWVHGDL
ncbi:protein kinase, partial [Streptomyces sp. BRB040]